MSAENPYTTPAVEVGVPDAPASYGWRVQDQYLLVSDGALLPMVDPYNGESESRMIMHPLRIKKAPLWISLFILCCIMIFTPTAISSSIRSHVFYTILWPSGLGVVAALVAKMLQPTVALSIFLAPRTIRRMKLTRSVNVLLCVAYLLMNASWAYTKPSSSISDTLAWIFGIGVVARIIMSIGVKRPYCRRQVGPLFEIRGFHPNALEYLMKKQTSRA